MKTFTFLFSFFIFFKPAWSQPVETIEVQADPSQFFHLKNPAQETMTEKEIEARGLFHSEELWNQFANLNTSSSTNRLRYLKIRGIGERSEYDTIPSNSVGLFYDQIDLSGLGGVLSLYDVSQVEVLKGPQTFFYGDSSLGGNILLSSSDAFLTQSKIWGDAGSQNRRQFGSQSSMTLSEQFAVKMGVQKTDSDGFFYNPFLGDHTSQRDELFANFGWRWDLGASHLVASHIYGENKNGNDFWNTDGGYWVFSDKVGRDEQLTHGHSLEWSSPVTANTHLLAIGSYSHSDQLVSYDEDWNNNPYWNSVPGWNKNYDYFKSYNRRKTNLHLKSILQHRWQSFDFSYGLHYYQKVEKADVNSFRNSQLRDNLLAEFTADKWALLLNSNYSFSRWSSLTASARIENQNIQYDDTQGFNRSIHNQPFAFNLLYSLQLQSYELQAIVSRGFKGAGFNPELNLTTEQQEYGPEYAMNYELILRNQNPLFSNNVSFFYLDRRHHQITTSSQDDPSDPSQFTLFVDNASRSHHYGVEWQGQWTPRLPFSVQSSVGLIRAEFVDHQLRNEDFSGRELAHSPAYTFSIATKIDLSSRLSLNLNGFGRDAFFFSNSHDQQSRPYAILNGSLNWQPTPSIQLAFWGKNLTNKRNSQRGFYFGNEPPNFTTRLYQQEAPPLEWGLRGRYNF